MTQVTTRRGFRLSGPQKAVLGSIRLFLHRAISSACGRKARLSGRSLLPEDSRHHRVHGTPEDGIRHQVLVDLMPSEFWMADRTAASGTISSSSSGQESRARLATSCKV